MEWINQTLQSTTAKIPSIEYQEIVVSPRAKVTFTAGVNVELLSQKIVDKLNVLEQQMNLSEIEITEIRALLLNLPSYSDFYSDGAYRVDMLKETFETQKLMNDLIIRLETKVEDREILDLYNKFEVKLKTIHNSPLKQHLLETLKNIYANYIDNIPGIAYQEQTRSQKVNNAKNIDDLDNALIDLMVSDYINLDTEKRIKVAKTFYEKKNHTLIEEEALISELKRTIEECTLHAAQNIEEPHVEEIETNVIIITEKGKGIEFVDGHLDITV